MGQRMSKTENDCMEILYYASKKNGKWVSLPELVEQLNIPDSTVRNIFECHESGIYRRFSYGKNVIKSDFFGKIATKYRYRFKIKKFLNRNNLPVWHIACVYWGYETLNNINDNINNNF